MRNVESRSVLYELLRLFAMAINRLSHKHITINGLKNVPGNVPVILAPNHQNALYDPLTIVLNSFFKPVFLTRADIFKKKALARILNFFGMAPVYRIRDGKDSLDKNNEVFDNCVRILKKNRMIGIFPEGAHTGIKSMLPHKKAIPRIVFMAGENTNFEIDVKIVPVGINYSHYFNFRRSVTINFGNPISSKDYYQQFVDEGETKASIVLRNDLFDALEKLIVHVPEKKIYELFDQSFELMKPVAYSKLGLKNSEKYFFQAERFLTLQINNKLADCEEIKELWNEKAKAYKNLKSKLKLNESELSKGIINFSEFIKIVFLTIVLFPFGLYGLISTGWFFYLSNYPLRKKFKDKQFYSSASFAINFILYPFWLFAHLFILHSIFDNWLIAIGLVLFSFPSGIIAWELGQLVQRSVRRLKMRRMIAGNNKQFEQLRSLREELIIFYKSLLD